MKLALYTFFISFLLVELALANPVNVLDDQNLPPEFEAIYDVRKGGMRVGKMQVYLKKTGEELIYESTTQPTGMAALFLGDQEITERAVLKLIDGHYKTVEFKHEMKGSDKDRNEHYVFDWENNKANILYKDSNSLLDVPAHTFDNFSTQLLLMREQSTESKDFIYSVISKGRLKDYVYTLKPQEAIETKLGKLSANKYVRTKDNEKKTTYLGWYAESLNYIPVRLDKFENGKLDISIQISEVNWL